jgi:hypothetical protein
VLLSAVDSSSKTTVPAKSKATAQQKNQPYCTMLVLCVLKSVFGGKTRMKCHCGHEVWGDGARQVPNVMRSASGG